MSLFNVRSNRACSIGAGLLALLILFPAMLDAASAEKKRNKLDKQIGKLTDYFEDTMRTPTSRIPSWLLSKAEGIVILRQYKAGFIFGVKGGRGVALVRDPATRRWSPPAFINTGEGSWGIQIGGQVIDSILVIMNEEGMRVLDQPNVRIGLDASASAGPVGAETEAKYTPGTPIYVYAKSGGLYAGASIEGGFLVPDGRANRTYYGDDTLRMADILFNGRASITPAGRELVSMINRFELK